MPIRKGDNLIKMSIGIPAASGRFTGYPEKGFVFGLDPGFFADIAEQGRDGLNGNEPEVKLLAAAFNRGRNFL